MDDKHWAAVDEYIAGLFHPADEALLAAQAASAAAGLPEIAVSPAYGKLLTLLAHAVKARYILEIGTLGGYSAICLGRGLAAGGRLITLEFNPVHADVARTNIAHANLADRIEVRVGRAVDSLATIAASEGEPFDLIFIDADKPSYPEYLEWSLRLSRPGTLIIADNVVRSGKVINPESDDMNVQGVRRFNELLAADPRASATILQTVGGKGYDGLAIAVVNAHS